MPENTTDITTSQKSQMSLRSSLLQGDCLKQGEYLVKVFDNICYFIVMQPNGQLVGFQSALNITELRPLWAYPFSPPGESKGPFFAQTQMDGRLAVFHGTPESPGEIQWMSSNSPLTTTGGSYVTEVQVNGALSIFSYDQNKSINMTPVWTSAVTQPASAPYPNEWNTVDVDTKQIVFLTRTVVLNDTLYLIARGISGVHTFQWQASTHIWNELPNALINDLSDDHGWEHKPHYSTIQVAALENSLCLIARSILGVHTYLFDPDTKAWNQLPKNTIITQLSNEELKSTMPTDSQDSDPMEKYYSTIRLVTLGNWLHLVMRGKDGIYTFIFDSTKKVWNQMSNIMLGFNDDAGWWAKKHYSTIQVTALKNSLCLTAKSIYGVHTYLFDPDTKIWNPLPESTVITALSDEHGWGEEQYYSTIRTVALDDQLYLVARGIAGVYTFIFDPTAKVWNEIPNLITDLSDEHGWGYKKHYSTIQVTALENALCLTARSILGIHAFVFDPDKKIWSALLEIPTISELSDAAGWSEEKYYSTIQIESFNNALYLHAFHDVYGRYVSQFDRDKKTWSHNLITNNAIQALAPTLTQPVNASYSDEWNTIDPDTKQMAVKTQTVVLNDTLYLITRGLSGVHTLQWQPMTNTWNELPNALIDGLNDAAGWKHKEYYSTIQATVLENTFYLMARGVYGVYTFVFDSHANTWSQLPTITALSDEHGWGKEQYYNTIRTVALSDQLYLVARGIAGVYTFIFDPTAKVWNEIPNLITDLSDEHGWGYKEYYSTIQATVLENTFYLIARGVYGIHTFILDSHANTWNPLPNITMFSDSTGWNQEKYYSTIQTVALANKLYLVARGEVGVYTFILDPTEKVWDPIPYIITDLSDVHGWGYKEYYSTIQVKALENTLCLIARGVHGIYTYLFDPSAKTWNPSSMITELTDAAGWNQEKYYSTIQIESFNNTLYLLAFHDVYGRYFYQFNKDKKTWSHNLVTNSNLMTNSHSFDRSLAYFFMSCSVSKNGLLGQYGSALTSLAQAFENSEFLVNRAFNISTANEIKSREVSENAQSDLTDLLKLDYAGTDHDNSVYGPAAYFYDLMRITLTHIQIGDANTLDLNNAKYSLLTRRPDLLDIPLDNKDTTDLMVPTLSMVNYILARQLLQKEDKFILHPNNTATNNYAELMTSYELAAFNMIANSKVFESDVAHWPFDLDFESQQAYLQAMGKSLYDLSKNVMELLNDSSTRTDQQRTLAKNYFGISELVMNQLKEPKACATLFSVDTQLFCKIMHIDYARLGELLHLNNNEGQERNYISSITDKKKLYINVGSNDCVVLTLKSSEKQEVVENLTEERIKRIGIFNYLSQQMKLNCDELELVLNLLNIQTALTEENVVALSLIKRLQEKFNLSISSIVNLFIKNNNDNQPLYAAAMENIRPLKGINNVWRIHWNLLPAYLKLFECTKEDAFTYVASLLDACKTYDKYDEIFAQLCGEAQKNLDYFIYYANKTLAYLAKIGNMNIAELSIIYRYYTLTIGALSINSINDFIKFIYSVGLLKKGYNKNLIELCQLVCFYNSKTLLAVTSDDDIIKNGIELIYHSISIESMQTLLDLDELNQTAVAQQWNLDKLMQIRFDISSDEDGNQANNIKQELLKPFFQDLSKLSSNKLLEKLKDKKDLALIESNVAALFGLDADILHRIMVKFKNQGNSFYLAIIYQDENFSSAIQFIQKVTAIIKFFDLKITFNDQAASDIFDDIDVVTELLMIDDQQDVKSIKNVNPNDLIENIVLYKKSQKVLGEASTVLLSYWKNNLTDKSDRYISKLLDLSKILNISLQLWMDLKKTLSFDSITAYSISNSIAKLNKLAQLKSLLDFLEQDTQLIIALLSRNSPQFISQHLAQVLQAKDANAYDKVARNLDERKRDILVESVLRYFHNNAYYDCFNLVDADKLSEYLLIDVSISSEDSSTPIVQAHSTMQWYLRRCIEGIEQDSYGMMIDASKINNAWWSWIQNYRVWEANRKVFLYPENFLSPDVRINQSDEFRQLSKALRKPYLDDDAITQVYLNYITNIMKLRNITLVTVCAEPSVRQGDHVLEKLHLFGCDNATPQQYYHCTVEQTLAFEKDEIGEFAIGKDLYVFNKDNTLSKRKVLSVQNWTFWEKVPLPITDISQDSPLRAIFTHNRPYLYWMKINTVSCVNYDDSSNTASNDNKKQKQLFCSYQHLDGSWEPAQLLEHRDFTIPNESDVNTSHMFFTIDIHGKFLDAGSSDSKPWGLHLLARNPFLILDSDTIAFTAFLKNLYNQLNTKSIEAMFQLDQFSLNTMPADHPWGQYYWELMHFAPLTLANALKITGQYDKALTWYKGLFNPSLRGQQKSPFVFAPFNQVTGNDVLNPLLNTRYLEDLHSHAFEAHRMATLRGSLPYKKYVVMQYIQNLITWGDTLFTDDTRESITEALSRYLAASDLLGDSPRKLYSATYDEKTQHQTLNALLIDNLSFVTPDVAKTTFVIYPYNYTTNAYFHVPENEEFMALWSNIADRLYKIRHCLNIAGFKQQLALFSPVLDPHQLVNAVAARGGQFVRDILNDLSDANRSNYRFLVMIERAKEFASFVERLGDSLLSILERQDNAALVRLNNDFAQQILSAMTSIRQSAIDQANYDKALLIKRLDSIQTRIDYYKKMLGSTNGVRPEEISAEILHGESAAMDAVLQGINVATCVAGAVAETGSMFAMTYGGRELKFMTAASAAMLAGVNVMTQYTTGVLERTANYKNRADEWNFQLTLAQKEMDELTLQQKAADLRIQVANTELDNHKMSMDHQQTLTLYNNTQFTNVDLYGWLADQLYDLYSEAYQLAIAVSKKAAASYEHELNASSSFTTNGFWVTSRKGLLSGQKLTQQLHQMQQDYMDKNVRLPEIEKVISLRHILETKDKSWKQIITDLLSTAGIKFQLKSDFFNDFSIESDNQERRIKMLTVTVPALASPNQQLNLILSNKSQEEIYISKGIASTGMFSSHLDDARYLPFEGYVLGREEDWTLKLGNKLATTTAASEKTIYDSITDIQLRIYYVIQPKLSPAASRK